MATLVVNLLDNTRKASKAGQKIYIFCKRNEKIGLSLCKAIAKAHHGELVIESEESAGTSVSVYLPLYEREE